MAYNVVSSVAWWMKSKIAGGLASCLADKFSPQWYNIAEHKLERSEWNGLEPFDLLQGWKGCEEYPDETS